MLQGLSDEQLVAQIAQRQGAGEDAEEECTELYRRYSAYVGKIVRSIVKNSSLSNEVDDITQTVFRKLFLSGLHQYEGRQGASFKGFLAEVTKNAVRDAFRARSRQEHTEQRAVEAAYATRGERPQVPAEDADWERMRLIWRALTDMARANPLDAIIIMLSTSEGMTDRQIGGVYDMTDEAVRKRRTRSYAKLRQLLRERHSAPEDVL